MDTIGKLFTILETIAECIIKYDCGHDSVKTVNTIMELIVDFVAASFDSYMIIAKTQPNSPLQLSKAELTFASSNTSTHPPNQLIRAKFFSVVVYVSMMN